MSINTGDGNKLISFQYLFYFLIAKQGTKVAQNDENGHKRLTKNTEGVLLLKSVKLSEFFRRYDLVQNTEGN